MTAITLSRQYGSLGCDVAHALGDLLGFRVVWRDLINQAALRAGAPEVALATIDELGLLGLRPSSESQQAYHAAVAQVMEELAQEGEVIIIGRAGQAILRGRPDVFHVRLCAPKSLRAERLSRIHKVPIKAAQAQVDASDRRRKTYLQRYYQIAWGDSALYDLIINTARLTPSMAADLISQAVSLWVPSNSTPRESRIE